MPLLPPPPKVASAHLDGKVEPSDPLTADSPTKDEPVNHQVGSFAAYHSDGDY